MEGGLSAFCCLYLFLLMETTGIMGQNAKPSFKAEAPNILCSTSSASPSVFSINLVPATSDLKLKYHIKISYEYSMPTKTQHHSLSLWRTIRTLEQQLNAQRTMIDAQNKIDIATASLTPGVIYMFDIEAESMEGTKSDVERFVLDYKDGNLYRMCRDEGTTVAPATPTAIASVNSNMTTPSMASIVTTLAPQMTTLAPQVTSRIPTDVVNEINSSDANENLTEEISTISLSGPNKIYAHVPLVIRAFPKFIGNINEYFIQWKINDLPSELRNIFAIRGSVFTVPSYSLFPGKTYTIEADLMDASNSESVASANHTVTIERHELRISMIPSNALIGVGRAIDIELKIQDYNLNGGRFKIQWRCVIIEESSEAESLCDRFNDVSEPKKSIVFTKAGMYHMEVIVVDELNLTAEAMSTIEVRNEIIARTQIDSMPKNPVDITKWVRGQASISYVVPKCVAKWSIVQNEGYAYEDTSVTSGIGEIIVNDFEANFLKGMNDYTNSTVTKHVKLHIPPPKEFPNWNGLKDDSKYRLRLQTSCPEPIDLDNPSAISKAKNNSKRIESFLEVDLETNGPPMTSPMNVAPDNALALLTPVIFNIPPAEDKDGPLFYSVGIIVDGKRLVLETGYDLKEIRSQIPFSEKPIETFYTVCDIYKACKLQNGPEITVNMSSEINFDLSRMQLDAIESGLDRGEYNSSLNNILIVGLTLKHLSDERIYKEFHQNIIKLIKAESKRIHKTYDDKSIYMSDKELFDYVQNVKLILETFEIRDRELIQDLLSLLEKITALKNEDTVARDIKRRRRKRQAAESPKSPVVKTANELLDMLDPDLQRIIDKLRWMCLDKTSTEEVNNTEYHVVTFNKSNSSTQEKFRVPNKGSGEWTATVDLKNLYDFDDTKVYCVGSAFNQSTSPVYHIFLFSSNASNASHFMFEQPKVKSMMDIAIHLNNTVKQENVACEMLVNGMWDDSVCKPSTLISPKTLTCTCNTNEPFRVKFVKSRPTVTEPMESLTPPTAITKSMEVTTEKIKITQAVEASASPVPMETPERGSSGSTLATVGYSSLGILALGGIFGAISLYLYRHSKKRGNSFALDLQAIAAEARTKTPGITYSRFQDEHMMQGDHVNFTSLS